LPDHVLLTFTGFHDPFVPTATEGMVEAGPVLTVVAEHSFDSVYLFSTPKTAGITSETHDAIVTKHPGTKVEVLDVPLKDPTNYLGILRQLRKHFRAIQPRHPEAAFSISVSSGTPHMHASWVLLAASGEIPATILQSTPRRFVPGGSPQVREIDILGKDFPRITRPLATREPDDDEEAEIAALCRQDGIIGSDPGFLKSLREAYLFGQYDDTHVLLLGETGSGKEYFSRFIHAASGRAARPLVVVNCSSLPENLVESQLFGHKKGAFTGASANHDGKFKAADGGTLFLDELGELPPAAQANLLRALEQGEIEPVGANRPVKVNVRVIAATNRSLRAMIAEGTFREDLYQRFGLTVRIPALRERRTDIPLLASHLLERWNQKHQKEKRLSGSALTELTRHAWPGNVRELRRVLVQSAILSAKTVIDPEDLRFEEPRGLHSAHLPEPAPDFDLYHYLDDVKSRLVGRALELSGGVQSQAAKLLGITPQGLNQFLKRKEHQ
jgi:DNA-binding NtrC family response regulator